MLNGDVVDCYPISRFAKKPFTVTSIDEEVDRAEGLMKELTKRYSKVTWIGGNHEDRVRKWIWKHEDIFSPLGERRGLRVKDFNFETLYGLKEFGVRYVDYKDGVALGKLHVTHGEYATKYTASRNLAKYNTSVLTGHNHRVEVFSNTTLAGEISSWTNGCLCTREPEYERHPNWQQCFAIVRVDKDDTFNVQQMRILRDSKDRPFFYFGDTKVRG